LDAVAAFGRAIGDETDPAGAVERLAALGELGSLRDFGVPEDELGSVAEAAAQRLGNQQNPRPATPAEIEQILRSIW
jgi:alcohol dehydrogenase class IV